MTGTATPTLVDGRYRVVRTLGEGTSSVVYLAEDGRDGERPVAIKVLRPRAFDHDAEDALLAEFALLARLRHPHLVRVRGHGRDRSDGAWYLVMDPVYGVPLHLAGLDRSALVEVGAQLCRALAFVHGRGVVHRDVTPTNVLVRDGHACLVDFGLARAADDGGTPAAGTLQTMAPEALSGAATAATDLFALGATLYHALVGEPLHGDADARAIVQRLTRDGALSAWVDQALRAIDELAWRDLLGRLLSTDPDLRPATADDVLEGLAELAGTELASDTPATAEAWVLGADLVAREAQLEVLDAWLDARDERVALVRGPSGVGKSRLTDELVARAHRAGLRVVRGAARRTTASGPGALAEAAQEAIAWAPDATLDRWGAQLRKMYPGHHALRRESPAATLEPRSEGRVRLAAITELLSDVAAEAPVLVVLEDAQWMGPFAIHALRALLRRTHRGNLRLLLTRRTGDEAPIDELVDELTQERRLIDVEVTPFGERDIGAWLDALFGPGACDDTVHTAMQRVREQVGGVPLAMRETSRRLLERGSIRRRRGRWSLASPLTVADLPADAAAALDARLGTVRDDVHTAALVDVLTLATRPLSVDVLRDACGVDDVEPIRDALAELEQRELVAAVVHDGRVGWALAHDMFRAPFARHIWRAPDVHLRLARAIDKHQGSDREALAESLAWHYHHTEEHDLAIEWGLRAARGAAERYENSRAVELADRILRRVPTPGATDTVAALLVRAAALRQSSRYDEAFVALDRAGPLLDALESPRLRADVDFERASGLHLRGRFDEAEPFAATAADAYREAGDRAGLADALGLLGRLFSFQGRYDEADTVLIEEYALVQAVASPRRVAQALGHRGTWHLLRFEHDAAAAAYRQQHDIASSIGDLRQIAIAMGNIGIIHLRTARYDEALQAFVAAVDACDQVGDRQGVVVGYGNMTRCHLLSGDLDAAMQCARRHLALAEETGDQGGRMIGLANLGYVYQALGDLDDAEQHLGRAAAIAGDRGARPYQGAYFADRATILLELGRADDAIEQARASLAVLEHVDQTPSRFGARLVLHHARAVAGGSAVADACVAELRALADEASNDEERGMVWRAVYDITRDDDARHRARGLFLAAYRERPTRELRRYAVALGADERRLDARSPRTTVRNQARRDDDFEQLMLVVHEISTDVGSRRLLDRIVDATIGFLRAERGVLALYPRDGAAPDFRVVRDRLGNDLPADEVAFSRTAIDRAAETREPLFIADALDDENLAVARSVLSLDLRSVICLPLVVPAAAGDASATDSFFIDSGALLGVLYADSTRRADGSRFTEENLRYVQALADQAAITLLNARRYDALSERLNRMSADIAESMRRLQEEIEVRERVEQELRRARDAAEEATAAKSRFLAVMSHEIRTPLNGVLGMARLLLDTGLDADQRGSVQMIQSSGDALLAILNDVLDFSRLEAGRVTAEHVPFDMREVIEDAVALLAQRAWDKGIELDAWVVPELAPMRVGDPGRLRQVVLNLVSNAVKFTDRGRVSVHARVRHDDPNIVEIDVHDTGMGIDPATRERLFDAFVQGDVSTTRRFGGTGLGLAITRELVHLMGGSIRVESPPEGGSSFRFTIVAPRDPGADINVTGPSLVGRHIGVIDANETRTNHIFDAVDAAGGRVTVQADGDVTTLLRMNPPIDLLVVDNTVLIEVTETLVARRRHPPILALVEPGGAFRFSDTVDSTLRKPVRAIRLVEAAHDLLSGSDWTRDPTRVGSENDVPSRQGAAARVLVVEDNAINRVVATRTLEALGYVADTAVDGRDAVRAVSEQDFVVVLMDLQMPVMDGIEATRGIRELDGPRGRVPILAMTASLTDALMHRCREAGMTGHVRKPIDREELADTLARTVGRTDG